MAREVGMLWWMLFASVASAEPAPDGSLGFEVHTIIAPERTNNPSEDYWRPYEVYGLITNRSDQIYEMVSGNFTFYDASGRMLGIDSIGTAVKSDAGDTSPGESVYAEVHYIRPGQRVPFHFMRNLSAFDGAIARHVLGPHRVTPTDDPPNGLAVSVTESLEGDEFSRKRVFVGSIRNAGRGGCRSPAFVAAFLDDKGRIAALDSQDASDDLTFVLAAGQSLPFWAAFSVTLDDAWQASAKVLTWVDCEPVY